MCLIPALRRQRLADLCEFKASLVYRVSARIGSKATLRNPVLRNEKRKKEKEEERKACKREKRRQKKGKKQKE